MLQHKVNKIKMNRYSDIFKMAESLVEGEHNFIANASNLSALIFEYIGSLNWVGYYFKQNDELILGPFQGRTACLRIKIGEGVCGKCAEKNDTIIVSNVHEFEGHIACDSRSNSEIVVPIIKDNYFYGVLDIDSPAFDRFNEEEKNFFESIVELLVSKSDIEIIKTIY